MASVECPFCHEEFGCDHLIAEGDDEIIFTWSVIDTLRVLCEDANLMKIDIASWRRGSVGFRFSPAPLKIGAATSCLT